jgi:hypothetical protein
VVLKTSISIDKTDAMLEFKMNTTGRTAAALVVGDTSVGTQAWEHKRRASQAMLLPLIPGLILASCETECIGSGITQANLGIALDMLSGH